MDKVCTHHLYNNNYDKKSMNYHFLSSMIQNSISGTKMSNIKSHGGSTPSGKSAQPQCTIVRIGKRPGRHHLRLNRILKELHKGDRVVLEFEGNYCDYDWAAISANPDGEHMPQMNFGNFRDTYTAALEKIQEKGAHIALLTLPALLPQRYFYHISRGLKPTAILHWLGGDVCNLNHWQEQYNEEIVSLAAQHGLPVIDINPMFLQRHYLDEGYKSDGMHPNATGQAVINEIVADWQARQS